MSTSTDSSLDKNQILHEALAKQLQKLGMKSDIAAPGEAKRRYRFNPTHLEKNSGYATLLRDARGVLRWQFSDFGAMPEHPQAASAMRANRRALIRGEIVHQFEFETHDPNRVIERITDLDRKLTPGAWGDSAKKTLQGLKFIRHGKMAETVTNPDTFSKKKILLIIHGTASNCQKCLNDLKTADTGREFLQALDLGGKYDHVLGFDHPTLSVSPLLNAIDLAGWLRPTSAGLEPPAEIDIVCHSRGGLVARWFCEALAEPSVRRRVVFVGSPLAGTSLAAPERIVYFLDRLTNAAEGLGQIAGALPGTLMGLVSMLLKLFNIAAGLAARRPVPDLVVSLVPGLAAQQRVGNNSEIARLRRYTGNAILGSEMIRYAAVTSNFELGDLWWKTINMALDNPLASIANKASETIFGNKNDLVVDTDSMIDLSDGAPKISAVEDFDGGSGLVYHTNYFCQSRTVKFIEKQFGI